MIVSSVISANSGCAPPGTTNSVLEGSAFSASSVSTSTSPASSATAALPWNDPSASAVTLPCQSTLPVAVRSVTETTSPPPAPASVPEKAT